MRRLLGTVTTILLFLASAVVLVATPAGASDGPLEFVFQFSHEFGQDIML